MRILQIHINNLNSLRQQLSIDFAAPPLVHAGIFAITGPTGAGKTTILDAITLALYGQVARSSKGAKDVISFGATECHAEVEFSVQDERYLASWRMHRARGKADGKLIGPKRELARWDEKSAAFVPIAEKIKEVDEAIESITKLDYQRFSRSVLLSQGDFAAFLKAGERERSDLLERITGTTIYSELSIAAFDRFRLEQQQLVKLQERLEQLGLLTEENIDESSVERQRTAANESAKAAEIHQQALQKLDRWLEAIERIESLSQEKERIIADQNAFLPQQERLKKSIALHPFRVDLEQIRFWEEQEEELKSALIKLAEELQELQQQQSSLGDKRAASQDTFNRLKKTATEKELIFRKVERLDQQLQSEEQENNRLSKEKTKLESEQIALQQKAKQLSQQLASETEELASLNQWLSEHQTQQELPAQLPLIEQQRERLLELFQQQEQQEKEQQQLNKKHANNKTAVTTVGKEIKQQKDLLKQQKAKFEKELPIDFKVDEQAATQRLSSAIMELQDQHQLIRQLSDLDEAYQRLLQEQQMYESRLEELLVAQQNNNKELLSLSDLRINYTDELKYKREIYQQQQLIANYEKDRQQLQPGEPCPLCLSEDHPFHTHPVTPFVDKAKADFEKAEAYAEKLHVKERLLLQQESELHQEIESLHGNDLKPVNGRLHSQREKLLSYEERIALLLHKPVDKWTNARGELLRKELQELETKLLNWRKAQKELETLEGQINTQEDTLQSLERKLLQLNGETQSLETQLERSNKDKTELAGKFATNKEKLDVIIKPLGYMFEMSTARNTFLALRELSKAYQDKQIRAQNLQQSSALLHTELTALNQQLAKQTVLLKECTAAHQEQQKEHEKILKKRQALLGEQKVTTARGILEQELVRDEANLQKYLKQEASNKEQLARLQQSSKDKQTEQEKRVSSVASLKKKLLPALKKLKYKTLATARFDQLPAQEEEQLQLQAQLIEKRQAETQRALQEAVGEKQKFQPKKTDQAAQDKIRTDWQEARAAQDKALLRLGQLEQQFQQQQERQEQHQKLLREIATQRALFNRWARLNEVIGQADGKKFRSYAQGLTLQRLVALANQHLGKLNGRYFISKQAGQDLELEIIDTFQADNRRAMFTLSGGESFLISLALALGLSDLAGKHAQIQSLFIDEGFGTLDEHSLDLALDTLENLQSGGKTIGIISHVKALKERISVQIQVHKKSDGFSVLELL